MQHLNLFEEFTNEAQAQKQKVPLSKYAEILSKTCKELQLNRFNGYKASTNFFEFKHIESGIAEAVFAFNEDGLNSRYTGHIVTYEQITLTKKMHSDLDKIADALVRFQTFKPNERYTNELVNNLKNEFAKFSEDTKSLTNQCGIIDQVYSILGLIVNAVTNPGAGDYTDEEIGRAKEALKNLGVDMSTRVKKSIEENSISPKSAEFLRKWWPEYTEHIRGKLDAKKFGFDK